MTKVLIGPSSFGSVSSRPLEILRENGLEVIDNPFKRRLKREELLDLLDDGVEALVAGLEPLDRGVLERSRLRVVSRCGSGVSNVDLEAAAELAIPVFNTPDAPVEAVAELTVGGLLSLARSISLANGRMKAGRWGKLMGREVKGSTVVIVGFGRIGRRVAQLLDSFGAELVAVDPAYGGAKPGVCVMELHEALPVADVITFHTGGQTCVMGPEEFELLKPGCLLLNTSRGGVVDEDALSLALNSGKVAGAFLDTFCDEPYSGSLLDFDQVVVTPHLGSYTLECRVAMETEAVENLIRGLSGHDGNVQG